MSLKEEIRSLSREHRLFTLFAMLSLMCFTCEYAATRPASQSIFLSIFSAHDFPYVWLATIPLNFLAIYLYNRFLPRLGSLKMMGIIVAVISLINLLMIPILPLCPQAIFFQFCWKDIYILLMFKQVWSLIHSTIPALRAKALYGIIFAAGTVGAITGSWIPGLLAKQLGSECMFFATPLLYALVFLFYRQAFRRGGAKTIQTDLPADKTRIGQGLSLILGNRPLIAILLLVVFMQASVALVEYQFAHELEMAFPIKDVRTAFTAKLLSMVNVASLALQVLGTYLLVQIIGIRNSHAVIPLFLLTVVTGQLLVPGFAAVALTYVCTKSIDFSLFGVMREMLFVPLNLDEKFRAKAVIDVFAYRTSKALASLLLLGLKFYVGVLVFSLSLYLSLVLFCCWVVMALVFLRKYAPKEDTYLAPRRT